MLIKPSSCNGCVLEQTGTGYMEVSGTGSNGVMLISEALGADEAAAGKPFVGKAGFTLDKLLQRGGLNREEFRIANTVFCQPPQNKLAGMWYMHPAIEHCSPNLDKAIADMQPKAIVTLGVTAFMRVLPEIANQHGVGLLDSKKSKGVVGYTFWSQRYNCWVTPTVHPSFILRGQTAWAQSLIFCLQRAVENARDGYSYEEGDYTLDCSPIAAHKWVDEFEAYYAEHPEVFLSADIETPGKDADEAELDLESTSDYIILRCGYSYRDGHALSIPWDGPYRMVHERLLNHPAAKCWWNGSYDQPRIISQGITIGGASHDGMDAWHILNSDLKKSLNFVTPWFRKRLKMWKHLSGSQPAFYNAVDADAAGSNLRGTIALLKKHNLYKVYEEFVLELDPVYAEMTRAGMPIDAKMRRDSAQMLTEKKLEVLNRINSLVPDTVKPITPKAGYKKVPKDTKGLTQVVFNGITNTYCTNCGVAATKKSHFKSKPTRQCNGCGAKWTAAHVKPAKKKPNPCEGQLYTEVESNPCSAATTVERLEGETRWAKMGRFVPSTKGILNYQKVKKHPFIFTGKGEDKKATTDEKAIKKLMGKHPEDKVYPSVLEFRELQTISSRYIGSIEDGKLVGGFPVGRDGYVHGIFRHSPSTLRSSMVSPNLQNIPRGDDSDIQKLVKQMFVAPPGYTFLERDFGGIEAVLVGYEAGSQAVTRLAKIDLHSYFTAYNLNRMGILPAADLPQLKWSDADLAGALHGIKKRFKDERQVGKKVIHCLTGEHEVLTPQGWVRLDTYAGQQIAQWSPDNTVQFVTPSDYIAEPYSGNIYSVEGRAISARMTPQHRIPFKWEPNKSLKECYPADLMQSSLRKVPVTGKLDSAGISWGALSLAIALQADGSLCESTGGNISGYTVFHFTKQRKIQLLRAILTELKLEFTEQACACHTAGVRFNIKSAQMQPVFTWLTQEKTKNFKLGALLQLSQDQRERFLAEILEWDASKSSGQSGKQTVYISTNKHNAEVVQTLAHVSGKQALLRVAHKSGYAPIYKVSFNARQFAYGGKYLTGAAIKPISEHVYCLTVPSSWFLIKHNDKISVTGNSANYHIGPRHMSEDTPQWFPRPKDAAMVLNFYYELFPEILRWHERLCLQVDKSAVVQNAFGHTHRFYQVLSWEKQGNEWVWNYGDDSKRLIAFNPQSNAALIGKRALKNCFYKYPDTLARWLRLFIHDAMFLMVPTEQVDLADELVRQEMEAPIPEMRLDPSWGMGDYLTIGSESKRGTTWASMK